MITELWNFKKQESDDLLFFMKKIFCHLVFFINAGFCFSQVHEPVKGLITNEKGEPLPYATVSVKNTTKGTISNSIGQFELKGGLNLSDTLLISYVGYISFEIPIDLIKGADYTIRLKEAVIRLDEIQVLPAEYLNNPNKIVKMAISSIKENCNNNPFVLKGFYRHVNKKDNEYQRLLEAAISIYDFGYMDSKMEFVIDEIRKSYDYRKPNNKKIMELFESLKGDSSRYYLKLLKATTEDILKDTTTATSEDLIRWENDYEPLSLNGFYYSNYARHYNADKNDDHFGILNESFPREHRFKLDTISEYDGDLVYLIKILPSNKSKKYQDESRNLVLPVGKIAIRTRDFAILKMEYSYILNPKKRGTPDYNFWLKSLGTGIVFTSIAVYKDYQGKMYLSYLKKNEKDPLAFSLIKKKLSNYQEEYYFLTRELLITDIILDSKKVEGHIEKISDNSGKSLYTNNHIYNEEFWDNYNILKETPIDKKLREDLEKKVSLDEQFREGRKEE
jgi:hypothetical protein